MASLKHILRLNAVSCIGFGVLFVFKPAAVAEFLGTMPALLLLAIGGLLIGNGAHQILAAWRSRPIEAEVLWFSMGDLVWWLGSLGILAANLWITTPAGTISVFVVAAMVAGLGAAQLALLGISRTGLSSADHWQRIGQSWLSLPPWVKIWLLSLNAVFLAAPAFLPCEDSRIILIGFAACGPLLLAFAVFEGGLSRIMGIAHLVPWAPLLGWLLYSLAFSDKAASAIIYVSLLSAMIAVCLALDLYDALRWLHGERGIILTPTVAVTTE